MIALRVLEPYKDDLGNEIIYDGDPLDQRIDIKFFGKNNRLVVAPNAKIVELEVEFGGNGSTAEIMPTSKPRTGLRFGLRLGQASRIHIGENVGSQGRTMVSAVEGTEVHIGDDCMLASGIEIRTDDSHPIYSVRTGKRVNSSRSISIGDHVWIAKHAVIMGGVQVGSGSVVGFRSIVTSNVPNNCVAVGAPARVVRRDIAWERPMVTARQPGDDVPGRGEKNERFWNLTRGGEQIVVAPVKRRTAWKKRIGKFVPRSLRPAARRMTRRAEATVAHVAHALRRGN